MATGRCCGDNGNRNVEPACPEPAQQRFGDHLVKLRGPQVSTKSALSSISVWGSAYAGNFLEVHPTKPELMDSR